MPFIKQVQAHATLRDAQGELSGKSLLSEVEEKESNCGGMADQASSLF